MTVGSKEHDDLMREFEKQWRFTPMREPQRFWAKGSVYQNGQINEQFIAFRKGYSLARCVYLNGDPYARN